MLYKLTGESGPAHLKRFEYEVLLGGKVMGSGSGTSKKEAEQMAAKAAMEALREKS